MKPATIFYVFSNSEIGGGNKVLLRLINGLDRNQYQPIALIPERGPFEEELTANRIKYACVDCRATQLTRFQATKTLIKLFAKCVAHGPAILHSNEYPYRLASMGCRGVRRVCHIHHPGFDKTTLTWLLRVRPDVIITPSEFIRDEVIRCLPDGIDATIVDVVWNPIDTNWFQTPSSKTELRKTLKLDLSGSHVCTLGTLAPHKGHKCFLRMAKRILSEIPDTSFHIIGGERDRDRNYVQSLHELVAELGLESNVRFWGLVDDPRARDLLAACDLFVLPSEEEGFGLVVAEAQSCEVPVLANQMRPIDEVMVHGKTGFLVSRGDDQEYAALAVQLLRDSPLRLQMGRAGRAWVEERFSIGQFTSRLCSIYQKLALHHKKTTN